MRTIIVALALLTLACAFKIPSLSNKYPVASYGRHSERSVNAAACPTYTYSCVAQGGNCTSDYEAGLISVCEEGTCGDDNICPTFPKLGDSCSSDNCITGLSCHPITKVCVVSIQIKPPGASCTSNNQCLYSIFGASDVSSTCSSGVCVGTALGSACTGPNQCSGRAYCSSGVCTALETIGQPCTSSEGLVAASTCNNEIVTRLFSVAAGAVCTTSDACGNGYYCNDTFTTAGICLSATGGGNFCDSSADCANGGYCSCYRTAANATCPVPIGNKNNEISVISSFTGCIDSQLCAINDFSCITTKCKSQYCDYRNYAVSSTTDGSCLGKYYENAVAQYVVPAIDCSNAAVQQVASFAVVASMILAVVLL